MNKIFLLFFCSLYFPMVATPQALVIKGNFELGTFDMKDLKAFQISSLPNLGVDVKSISTFPPYTGYSLSILFFLKSGIGIGVVTDFFSTGGRNYYADYSGSYSFDLLTKAYNFGSVISYKNFYGKHHLVFFEMQQGVKYSTMNQHEKLVLTETLKDESQDFISTSWWLTPGIRYEYLFAKCLSVGVYAGGEINPKSTLHIKGNKEAYMTDNSGEKITINWSGLRVGLSFSVNLGRLLKKENDQSPIQ